MYSDSPPVPTPLAVIGSFRSREAKVLLLKWEYILSLPETKNLANGLVRIG